LDSEIDKNAEALNETKESAKAHEAPNRLSKRAFGDDSGHFKRIY
jgi:hypothetical protein